MIGVAPLGRLHFWSFTSDGKNSNGTIADVTDIHPEAIGFEAQMPAGLARMAYWPDDEADSTGRLKQKTKKGGSDSPSITTDEPNKTIADCRLSIADCRLPIGVLCYCDCRCQSD